MSPDKEKDLATEIGRRFDEIFGTDSRDTDEFGETTIIKVSFSPIRDLKSLVLSMDWEITDQVLDRFGEELVKLEKIYSENRIILQLLQILGALCKYIRNKGVDSHPESIKLLHSVFNCLEDLVIQNDIPVTVQKQRLKNEIEKFKTLKQKIAERHRPASAGSEAGEQTEEQAADQLAGQDDLPPPVEEASPPEALYPEPDQIPAEEQYPDESGAADYDQGPDQPALDEGLPSPPPGPDESALVSTAEIISDMSPHEAFAYALDELKNILRAEFSALRAELRMWRQGQ